jgi:hypothetical protein
MKALRWIAAFPVALVVSIGAWFFLSSVLTDARGDPDLIARVFDYAPIIIRASIPTLFFVIFAVLITPSKGRKVGFIYFAVSILFSGGGAESLRYYQLGMAEFWVASFVGVIIGALAGLLIALRLQVLRARKERNRVAGGN